VSRGAVTGFERCRPRWRGPGLRGRGGSEALPARLFGRRDRPKRNSSAWLQRHALLIPACAGPRQSRSKVWDETGSREPRTRCAGDREGAPRVRQPQMAAGEEDARRMLHSGPRNGARRAVPDGACRSGREGVGFDCPRSRPASAVRRSPRGEWGAPKGACEASPVNETPFALRAGSPLEGLRSVPRPRAGPEGRASLTPGGSIPRMPPLPVPMLASPTSPGARSTPWRPATLRARRPHAPARVGRRHAIAIARPTWESSR